MSNDFGNQAPSHPIQPVGRNWKAMGAAALMGGTVLAGLTAWAVSGSGEEQQRPQVREQPPATTRLDVTKGPRGYDTPPTPAPAPAPPTPPTPAPEQAPPPKVEKPAGPRPLENPFGTEVNQAAARQQIDRRQAILPVQAEGLAQPQGPTPPGEVYRPGMDDGHDQLGPEAVQNQSAFKSRWVTQAGGRGSPYLDGWRAAPNGYMVRAGNVIQGVTRHSVNSDLPGDFVLQVTTDVYDSATQSVVLIPATSEIYCMYNNQVSYGQSRAQTACKWLTFPDNSMVDLGSMVGTDPSGAAGVDADVNRHPWQMAGAIAVTVLSRIAGQAGQLFAGGGDTNIGVVGMGAAGDAASDVGNNFVSRELNRANTLTIPEGAPMGLMLQKHLILPEWRG